MHSSAGLKLHTLTKYTSTKKHVSSDGYHIQFRCDEAGKLVAPNDPRGSYCNVGVSLSLNLFIFTIIYLEVQ